MEKSRTKYSILNGVTGATSQASIVLLGFISRTAFIRFLPLEYLGVQGLFTNVLTVLSFAELGIGEAMIYALYKPVKENNKIQISRLICFYKKAYRYVALVVFSLGLAISFFIDAFVDKKPDIPENFQIVFLLFVVNSACSYLFSYKKSILLVDQKRFVVTGIHQVFITLQTIFQIVFLYITHDYIIFLIIQILGTMGDNVCSSYYVDKKYPFLGQHIVDGLSRQEEKTIFGNVKAVALTRISGVISNGFTNIIISKILGLVTVGIASNYLLIVNAVNGVLWTAFTGISNSIGNLNVDATLEKRRQVFDQLFLVAFWVYTCACVCILVLINPFIQIWLGNRFLLPEPVIFAIVWYIYIGGINYPAYSFRTTLGYFVQVQYVFLLGGLLSVIFSVIGGLNFGLVGIFLGTPIARLMTSEVADGYMVYRYGLKINPWVYFKKYILYFMLFLFCYGIARLGVSLIQLNGIFGLIIKTILVLTLTNTILLAVFLKTKIFHMVAQRFLSLKRSQSINTNDK